MSKSKAKKVHYPECEKMNAVSEESNKIGAFLDWLINEKGFDICEEVDDGFEINRLYAVRNSIEELLAEYFDIDLDKVEKERREILKSLNK